MYNSPEYQSIINVARAYVKEIADPQYPMKKAAGKQLGNAGEYGQAHMGYDKDSVLKKPIEDNPRPKGNIGPQEMAAMEKMDGTPGFPRLLNTDVKKTKDGYQGNIAISLAKGQTLADTMKKGMPEDKQKDAYKKIIRLREKMHKKGIAHNDMHDRNLFVDDDNNPSVIDFGKANIDPLAALGEALGTVNVGDIGFEMSMKDMLSDKFNMKDPEMQKTLRNNYNSISKELRGLLDEGESEEFDSFLRHSSGDPQQIDHDDIRNSVGKLKDNDYVMSLIDRFYDGVGENTTSDRMNRAVGDLRNIKNRLGRGGNLRRGEIEVPDLNLDD
jgi:serine/threonine protein kinase